MDDRTMPLATFRCRASLDQATVRLTRHLRRIGKRDECVPQPLCPRPECERFGLPMQDLVGIDYGQGGS